MRFLIALLLFTLVLSGCGNLEPAQKLNPAVYYKQDVCFTYETGEMIEQKIRRYLGRFRRIIPPIGMIDISPIVGFLLLSFAIRGFYSLLVSGTF